MGSRCAQYHAPLPFIAFVRTMTNPSYLLCTAFAVNSSVEAEAEAEAVPAETESTGGGAVVFVEAAIVRTQMKNKHKKVGVLLWIFSILKGILCSFLNLVSSSFFFFLLL